VVPEFIFRALDGEGEPVKGSLHATNRAEAQTALESRSLFVEKLSQNVLSASRKVRVSDKEFLGFTKQLASLLRAGMPLVESIAIARKRGHSKAFGAILENIEAKLKDGGALADVCGQYPDVFDEIFLSNVRTAEKGGGLYQALSEYQSYLVRRITFQSTLKKAIAYPVFLVVTLVVVLGFLFVFIVPSFSELFDSFNAELPYATRLVLGLAETFPVFAGALVAMAVSFGLFLKLTKEKVGLQQRLDAMKLKIPVAGRIVQHSRFAQISRNMATMVSSGMPLVASLDSLAESFEKTSSGPQLRNIRERVMEGIPLHKAMLEQQLMSEQAVMLIEAGESAGDLAGMMSEVADYYESELTDRLDVIMSLFEPVLMLLIGFVVGGIIVSMYLPIFYLAEVVQ
jgi:type IV pilus assembly protein PilC